MTTTPATVATPAVLDARAALAEAEARLAEAEANAAHDAACTAAAHFQFEAQRPALAHELYEIAGRLTRAANIVQDPSRKLVSLPETVNVDAGALDLDDAIDAASGLAQALFDAFNAH